MRSNSDVVTARTSSTKKGVLSPALKPCKPTLGGMSGRSMAMSQNVVDLTAERTTSVQLSPALAPGRPRKTASLTDMDSLSIAEDEDVE